MTIVVMDVRSCMKVTLVAIIILSVVTFLSHMYSCIKIFLESLPSIVSAVIAPKCLFILSNIIVVFLVSESKLSRRRSKLKKTDNESSAKGENMLQDSQKQEEVELTQVLLPALIGERKQEQENKMTLIVDEEKDAPVGNEDVKTIIAVDEEQESSVGKDSLRIHQCEEKMNQLVLYNIDEVLDDVEDGGYLEFELEKELSGDVQQEGPVEGEVEEWELPTADDLNRRVEDFIARFNMERQLEEARMFVCCY
ncbi:unnamed protein product [Urochloa decumbens]|uniref:DUF4408 domain-containing protein n=2 Tax=Urochloa decumbens TaxID=240449 RepID=A0ABC8VZK6_9POAL